MKSNQNVNALAIHYNDHTNFSSHPFNRLTLYICNFSRLFGLQFKIACYQLLDDWVEFWSINYSDMYQYQLKKGVRELVFNTCGKRGKKCGNIGMPFPFRLGLQHPELVGPKAEGMLFVTEWCFEMLLRHKIQHGK